MGNSKVKTTPSIPSLPTLLRELDESEKGRPQVDRSWAPEVTGSQRRKAILDEVAGCVCKDRQTTYGDAEDNFANIAAIANVMLGPKLKAPLDATDVALFSCAIKAARLGASRGHRDNWIDLAGYAVCGLGIVDKTVENHEKSRA